MGSRANSAAAAGSAPHSPAAQHDEPATVKMEDAPDAPDASDTQQDVKSAAHTPAPLEAKMDTTAPEAESSDTRQRESSPRIQESEPASNYGTRSRNRNARPNYAEDQDMDFEFAPPKPAPASAKSAISSEAKRNQAAAAVANAVSDSKRVTADTSFTRFVNINSVEQSEKSPSVGKESIVGTPTVATNPPKKRKAAANAAAAVAAVSGAATLASAKRTATAQSLSTISRETNMMTFETSKATLKKGTLVADDGTVLSVEDHVYLVCEPPGDPYYLCRIMEFLHVDSDNPKSPVDSLRVNWFYRPRDVQRHNSDTRLVYGTMHSDVCPLTSLRGKCEILHRSEIKDFDEYRKGRDCFWFSQIFDRFIRRFYEIIPTSQIINVPEKVKKALDQRWRFIAVETGRVKELTSAVKSCKRCSGFCASTDSVDCAICGNSYHMNCVRPPLPKKPSRGFAWACGPCSRVQDQRMADRNTPILGQTASAADEEEVIEEEEEDPALVGSTRAPSPSGSDILTDQHPGTQAEIALARMWPFRYLGIHCRVEDALLDDDRAIYPRASSRLGPRHQANVNVWHGQPVELVKPAEIKKRYVKNSGKKETKLTKETIAAIEAERIEKASRPKHVQDEPVGYVHRGEDFENNDPRNTARLLFKMPTEPIEGGEDHSPAANEAFIDNYMRRVKQVAKSIKVQEYGSNLLDKALQLLIDNGYDAEKSLQQLSKVDRAKDLKEPILTPEELKKFEEGVQKYGSEHRLIRLHMKTSLPNSTIVRFYYLWKKTPRGRQIWDNYGGRKGNKKRQNLDAAAKMQAEVADDVDDSAFDNGKAVTLKRGFQCKFCSTRTSRQWRRAPGVSAGQSVNAEQGKGSKDKNNKLLLALCGRCAGLWRRYAIQYEDLDEMSKKAAQSGGKAWKKKIDEELLREILAANEAASTDTPDSGSAAPSVEGSAEPPRKKAKTGGDGKKEKVAPPPKLPTPPPPPIVPEAPRWRDLPCAICHVLDAAGEMPVSCARCKLTVHKRCYGLSGQAIAAKWSCDQCMNDVNPIVSTDYACTLCPIEETVQDLLEPPKVSHKKKTDREREKERLEKELMETFRQDYANNQKMLSRPLIPREPLKKTDGNNWVHVLCAAFTPEVKFSDANLLERAEGFSVVPQERLEMVCKLCKRNKHGSCVTCQQCRASFHVGCAAQAGYTFGFDVTPVKSSRKDQVTTVTLGGETGYLTAAIWCKEHSVKTVVHPVSEAVDEAGKNALQIFVENYKQADRTLTGTARKANLLSQSAKLPQSALPPHVAATHRRSSAVGNPRSARNSSAGLRGEDAEGVTPPKDWGEQPERTCVRCGIDVSPKWWPASIDTAEAGRRNVDSTISDAADGPRHTNGDHAMAERLNGSILTVQGEVANKGVQQYHCHKCHWRRHNEPTPPPEPERTSHSPPKQFSMQHGWGGPSGAGPQPIANQFSPGQQPAHIPPDTSSRGPPPAAQAPQYVGPLQAMNGLPPPPPPQALQPNGIGGHVYPPVPAYAQANGQSHGQHHRPPSVPLNNLGPGSQRLSNGVISPGYPLPSPTFHAAMAPSQSNGPARATESPYAPGQQHGLTNGQHASPQPGFARPQTPRDSSADARVGGNGASASPSVMNLLS
ncbi:hypothetical protein MBLNU459_g7426t2 [Dothideomycetes sp. NU459]